MRDDFLTTHKFGSAYTGQQNQENAELAELSRLEPTNKKRIIELGLFSNRVGRA